ncbi:MULTISPECIES: hypothetical protein [Campylobacter]|uniref:hypothetical protein n=1 Tax=Campylobacter TaxID=194 RepID=UPI00254EC8A8|nr:MULTISPECIES: hypothetical protein [Campylobacter]MBQ8608644.1 hypothetical protein [Campylobacter sp.]MDL0104910.1 hypothetical protein [Campylobacter ovis]MDL0105912.1 hypothetical protein [Campylobacter ovis]
MLEEFLKDSEFASMMHRNIYDLLNLLMQKNIQFDILVSTKFVNFSPELPQEIKANFNPSVILFSLAGYSLSSVEISKDEIKFEAGFGPDNFASVVSIPIGAIIRISIDENPILINFATYSPSDSKTKQERSKQIFLNNPKNRDIFKGQ